MGKFAAMFVCFVLTLTFKLCSSSPMRLLRKEPDQAKLNPAVAEHILTHALKKASEMYGEKGKQRLAVLETALQDEFVSRLGSATGHIYLQAARSLLSHYFAREHGWLIKGLESGGDGSGHGEALHEVDVIHETVPHLAAKLAAVNIVKRGLELKEVAVVALVIERHIIGDSISLLEAAYELNGHETKDSIGEESLHSVLQSYLLLFRQGMKADRTDVIKHQKMKSRASKHSTWKALEQFEAQATSTFNWNKGVVEDVGEAKYSFEDVAHIVELLALRYGQWQDVECQAMKKDLMSLDTSNTGRVSLSAFHAQPMNKVYGYKFTESAEYLRQVGALEEKVGGEPSVLTVNYLNGPSNCIATSRFFSVCCINGCAAISNKIVKALPGPVQKAESIIEATVGLPGKSKDETTLTEELYTIAHDQGGEVALFGASFAQWLNHAFPSECPVPHVSEMKHADAATTIAPPLPGAKWPNADECTRIPVYTV